MNTLERNSKVKDQKEYQEFLHSLAFDRPIAEVEKLVNEIEILKEQRHAVILGHNYMSPDVFYGVSDFSGDSFALARYASNTKADVILFNGVYFMAETAKILNPDKKVLIADVGAGCSLSESITGQDVRQLKKENPDIPVVTYINCSAEVKAEADVVCTSANAGKIVNALPGEQVIMIPDMYLAANVQKETDKKIIPWHGKCMVHELFSLTDVMIAKEKYPQAKIVAHPECLPQVAEVADFTGSTSLMGKYISDSGTKQVLLLTECSMGANLKVELPNVEFVSSCQICPHMGKITLEKIRDALRDEKYEVDVDEEVIRKAQISLNKMLQLGS